MFNLTVETAHTFYVGQNGWLVHNANLPRYDGPKPSYSVNPAHVPGQQGFNPKKTPLPADAESVFKNAIPNSYEATDKSIVRVWWGANSEGQIYRFSVDNNNIAHFSGIDGVGDGVGNMSNYAKSRLLERFPGVNIKC